MVGELGALEGIVVDRVMKLEGTFELEDVCACEVNATEDGVNVLLVIG